jgi:hypothetical protein
LLQPRHFGSSSLSEGALLFGAGFGSSLFLSPFFGGAPFGQLRGTLPLGFSGGKSRDFHPLTPALGLD